MYIWTTEEEWAGTASSTNVTVQAAQRGTSSAFAVTSCFCLVFSVSYPLNHIQYVENVGMVRVLREPPDDCILFQQHCSVWVFVCFYMYICAACVRSVQSYTCRKPTSGSTPKTLRWRWVNLLFIFCSYSTREPKCRDDNVWFGEEAFVAHTNTHT